MPPACFLNGLSSPISRANKNISKSQIGFGDIWHILHNLIQCNAKSRSVAGLTAPNPQPDLSVQFLRASEGFFKQTDACHPLIRSCCLNLLITEYLRGNGQVQHPCGSAGSSCSGKRSCSAAGLPLRQHAYSLPFPKAYL